MGFETEPTINYDLHQVISNRIKDQTIKPFKHEEVVGLEEVANWLNYPKEAPKIIDLDEDSSSPIREVVSLSPDISNFVSAVESITPLASQSEGKNKRDFPKEMDTEEEDSVETPKRQKIETEGQLVLDTTEEKGKGNMKILGLVFEVKEYMFVDTPIDSSTQSRTKQS